MNRILCACIFLSPVLMGQQGLGLTSQSLPLRVDRENIQQGESFRLYIEMPGNPSARPDTTPLDKDFHVFGVGYQSQMSLVNGKRSQTAEWVITLQPLHSGALTLPPLQVGSQSTQALKIQILPPQVFDSSSGSSVHPVVVEVQVENLRPYVQSKVLVTAKVWMDETILGGSLTDPELKGALLERIGEDQSYSAQRGGKMYQVIERRYALFPQSSGSVKIPPMVFDGSRRDAQTRRRGSGAVDPFFGASPFDSLFTRATPIRALSEEIDLEVQPKPDAAKADWWLPARHVELLEQWNPEPPVFRVGEPVTRNIFLRAIGLADAQMPELHLDPIEGCKSYPGVVQHQTDTKKKEVLSIVLQPIDLVPTRAGSMTLPAIEVPWWDIASDTTRIARLEARTVTVLPALQKNSMVSPAKVEKDAVAAAPEGSKKIPTPESEETTLDSPKPYRPWLWGSGLTAVGFFLLVFLRRNSKKQKPSEQAPIRPSRKKAERFFRQECLSNNPQRAELALLQLGMALWPQQPPRSGIACARRLNSKTMLQQAESLDALRFGGTDQSMDVWQGNLLWEAYLEAKNGRHLATISSPLPPLYPQQEKPTSP